MVATRLIEQWAQNKNLPLVVIGTGPQFPAIGVDYVQLPSRNQQVPIESLSEWEYARFCGEFALTSTNHLRMQIRSGAITPKETIVIVNDISESPDISALNQMGFTIVSLWHVDVVDFFNRMYLRQCVCAHTLVRLFNNIEKSPLGRFIPKLLRLIFQKQRIAVESSHLLVVPSRAMGQTIRRCFPRLAPASEANLLVLPWGVSPEVNSREE